MESVRLLTLPTFLRTLVVLFLGFSFLLLETHAASHQLRTDRPAPRDLAAKKVNGPKILPVQGEADSRSQELNEAKQLDEQVEKFYNEQNYQAAVAFGERSLAIRKRHLGAADLLVAKSLNNLAGLHMKMGQYAKAEPLLRQALQIREAKLGPDDLDVAVSANFLAGLYQAVGDYGRAELLFKRALEIRQKKLDPNDLRVARSLNNLGLLYKDKREYVQAEQLLLRALEIRKRAFGSNDHPDIGNSLNSLAVVYQEQGQLERAQPLYDKALEIFTKAYGPTNPTVANSLHNLAVLYLLKGEYNRAEPLYQQTLRIMETTFGPQHPDFANALESLAIMYQAKGDIAEALELQMRCNDIREHNLALLLNTGSEDQKRLYMETLAIETDISVTLHVRSAPNDERATRLALTTILRRKGRVLDAMADSVGALRRRSNSEDRKLLEEFSALRANLAMMVFRGPAGNSIEQHNLEMTKLQAQADQLEEKISERSAEFRIDSEPITLERIQHAIPADGVLVEIAIYRPFNPLEKIKNEATGRERYVAYVLRSKGAPVWVELGEAAPIEKNIVALREGLANPWSQNFRQSARTLDEQIMRPIRRLLENSRKIFLCPDGPLNLIPFGGLVDENNNYLVEKYAMTYLTSGRDLLRLQLQTASRQPPVVIANPTFGYTYSSTRTESQNLQERASRSSDFNQISFSPLDGTAGEAKALRRILAGATVLTGPRATEIAVKQVTGPSILHVATHGFFLEDQRAKTRGKNSEMWRDNPLLRSGIVLAGANQLKGGAREDGILTALEAAGLDLWGTKVVVLSACETGVGDIRKGDGVYGLRRALTLAGAESQVMSLWKVDDAATRDLMVEYYRRLKIGEGRNEALRNVQLKMLHGKQQAKARKKRATIVGTQAKGSRELRLSHPYFWASFIQSGDWRSLQ